MSSGALDHAGRPRVAVTGMGVVTPAGHTIDALFDQVVEARSAAAEFTIIDVQGAPVRFGCEVRDFDAESHVGPKEVRRIDRAGLFGIGAANDALAMAGTLDVDPARVSVVGGTGVGGLTTLEEQVLVRDRRGPMRVSPFTIPMLMANATAGLISMRHGFTGISICVATACAAGTNAIGEGVRMIRDGSADVVVAGGTEAAITPTSVASFGRMGALSGRNDDPQRASRPFDRDRDGFVIGEGAGFMVLERWDVAVARGARIYGEVAGYGRTSDAHHITAPAPGGVGAVACMEMALADAGLSPTDIGHINAHGTSTPLNDAAEAEAVSKVFGPQGPPVTGTKGVTGHMIGAAGAVEAVLALVCASRGVVPPTANCENPDVPADVDIVRGDAREIAKAAAISNSFGFGGHNASLVVVPGPDTA